MDISLFVQRRKSMGISQSDLCQGICTQATLSRFENQGQVPSIKILIRLCHRLDMNLGELFPNVESEHKQVNQHLEAVEHAFVAADYHLANQHLAEIKEVDLSTTHLKKRYLYLKGFLAALQKSSLSDSFFYLNQLITDLQNDQEPLFTLLAYTGLGMAYANASEYNRAHYYYKKAQDGLYDIPVEGIESLWRLLGIAFHTATFYATAQDYDLSDQLLGYGIRLCSQHSVTYYLDRLYFRLAQNAEAEHVAPPTIHDYCSDARAFARLNHNQTLLTRIRLFESNLS